jgi:pyridoxine 5-phosphate synthase
MNDSKPKVMHRPIHLGVNVDHVATLRQARGVSYPDPAQAADIARKAGADGITVHLREDRRHIQDADVFAVKEHVSLPLNFEMGATQEMLRIALKLQPHEVCLVPEKRSELTTEGGLDVLSKMSELRGLVTELKAAGILVSMFIDPVAEQIQASQELGADIVELHTGEYANADETQVQSELNRIVAAAKLAVECGLQANAGHGLHYQNVQAIAAITDISGLNIGHAIVARAVITGMHEAVFSMKQIMNKHRILAEEAVL